MPTQVVIEQFTSRVLADNPLNDPATRPLPILLPPDYVTRCVAARSSTQPLRRSKGRRTREAFTATRAAGHLARRPAYGTIGNAVGSPTPSRPRMRGYRPRDCGLCSDLLNLSTEVAQGAFVFVACFPH
jgi:hypothetical protein